MFKSDKDKYLPWYERKLKNIWAIIFHIIGIGIISLYCYAITICLL